MTKYQQPRNIRGEGGTPVDKIKAGKLYPTKAIAVRPSEGGVVHQNVVFELDPILGRMLTPIYAEVTSVFVPVQALDAIKAPDAQYAGMTEVIRDKLLSGSPLFGLETEGEISKRCHVNPRSISGVKKVNEMVRLAYNVAVNHLRMRKYVNAALLLHSNTAITPAIVSQTVLERFNGVLDPDPKINGQVHLEMPSINLPVLGINQVDNSVGSDVAATVAQGADAIHLKTPANKGLKFARKAGNPAGTDLNIYASLAGSLVGGFGLNDLHNAERTEEITREIRKIIDDNPEYGEAYALRYIHGLSIDKEGIPMIVGHRRERFGGSVKPAMDQAGIEEDVMRSDLVLKIDYTIPIPRTELGGIIITLVSVKPDETIPSQPHPILSDVWGVDNFAADELEIEPKPVYIRDLDSDCLSSQENTIAFYTGYNAMKQNYNPYGLTRNVDPNTVENKTRVWQLNLPLSVTPDNILYPASFLAGPWPIMDAEICTVVTSADARLPTPMILGPSPVEALATIDDADIFGDDE